MSLTRRAFDLVGTAAMGVAKGGIDFTAGATAAAVKGGIVIGKPLAKGAGKVAEGVGGAAIDFFGGAGESAVTCGDCGGDEPEPAGYAGKDDGGGSLHG